MTKTKEEISFAFVVLSNNQLINTAHTTVYQDEAA